MAKKKTKASKLIVGSEPPTSEETTRTVKEVAEVKPKRIPFTTSLDPANRAYLEDAAFTKGVKIADIINELLIEHFKDKPQTEFYKAYLKRLTNK